MSYRAYVLAGAGARLPFEAGVLTALSDNGDHVDFLVGCSSGALVSAGYAYLGIDGLNRMWKAIKSRSDIFATRYDVWNRAFWLGKYDAAPLRKLIEGIVTTGIPNVAFGVVYSDLITLKKCVHIVDKVPQDDVARLNTCRLVEASASLPGVVPPVLGRWCDGGVFEIAPLKEAIDRAPAEGGEVTVILSSNLNADVSPFKPKTLIDVVMRAVDGMCDEIMRGDIEECVWANTVLGKKPITLRIIQPPKDWHMDTLDFDPKKMQEAFDLGLRWRDYNG